MRKIFIESCLLEEDTFLYGVQMPGFFAMCMMGTETALSNKQVPFVNPEKISKEDLKDFGNLYIVAENSPALNYMVEVLGDMWEDVIGIVVDRETKIARDIITPLETVVNKLRGL
jgi:hypothetical protein